MSLYGHVIDDRLTVAFGWTLFYLVMPVTLIWCPPGSQQPMGKALVRIAWVGWISVLAKLLVHLFIAFRNTGLELTAEATLPRGELVRQTVREQPVEALALACAVAGVVVVCRTGFAPWIGWTTFGLMLLTTFYLAPIFGTEVIVSGSQGLERIAYALLLVFGLVANAPAWLMPFAIGAAKRLDAASASTEDHLRAAS
jgi:hypothetical protein